MTQISDAMVTMVSIAILKYSSIDHYVHFGNFDLIWSTVD